MSNGGYTGPGINGPNNPARPAVFGRPFYSGNAAPIGGLGVRVASASPAKPTVDVAALQAQSLLSCIITLQPFLDAAAEQEDDEAILFVTAMISGMAIASTEQADVPATAKAMGDHLASQVLQAFKAARHG